MHLETALAIFEGEGCEREAMIVCDNLGDALLRQARYPEAEAYLQRALQSAERMGDGPSLSVSLANLGILALRRGRLAEGERLLTQACLVAERVQDSVYVSLWSSYLALLLHAQGKCGEAQGSIRRAFSAGRKVPSCLGAALVQLGWMRLTQVTFGHLEALRLQANSTWSACHCARCNKLLVGTERSIRRVLPLAGIEAETRVEALLILASVLVLRECRDEARQYLRLAQEEAQQGELAWLVAHATRVEAQLEMLAGHFEQANQCFAQAHGLFHRYEMHLEEARTLSLHGTALCLGSPNDGPSLAQLRRGASYLREAARLAENCQAPLDQHRIAWLLGHLSSSHEPSQARS